MARIDYTTEKRFAQKELMKAGNEFASVKMRLAGTTYAKRCEDIMAAIQSLNNDLVADIRKGAGK